MGRPCDFHSNNTSSAGDCGHSATRSNSSTRTDPNATDNAHPTQTSSPPDRGDATQPQTRRTGERTRPKRSRDAPQPTRRRFATDADRHLAAPLARPGSGREGRGRTVAGGPPPLRPGRETSRCARRSSRHGPDETPRYAEDGTGRFEMKYGRSAPRVSGSLKKSSSSCPLRLIAPCCEREWRAGSARSGGPAARKSPSTPARGPILTGRVGHGRR